MYKIVLIGDSGVGKSNILWRFTNDKFDVESKTTLGVEFASKNLIIRGHTVSAQIWDTAGQERYRSITKAYYKEAVAALIIYDITKQSSFQSVGKWLKELQDHADCDMAVGLVGNKCDLKQVRAVSERDGADFADKNGMIFAETSALNNINIDRVFNMLVECKL